MHQKSVAPFPTTYPTLGSEAKALPMRPKMCFCVGQAAEHNRGSQFLLKQ